MKEKKMSGVSVHVTILAIALGVSLYYYPEFLFGGPGTTSKNHDISNHYQRGDVNMATSSSWFTSFVGSIPILGSILIGSFVLAQFY